MRQERHIHRPEQFKEIYSNGLTYVNGYCVIRALAKGNGISHYGISVSSRVGNSVIRNKVKRRLREILRRLVLREGWDFIVIARNQASKANFYELSNSVRNLLMKAGIIDTGTDVNKAKLI